jgi:hypothetical protein
VGAPVATPAHRRCMSGGARSANGLNSLNGPNGLNGVGGINGINGTGAAPSEAPPPPTSPGLAPATAPWQSPPDVPREHRRSFSGPAHVLPLLRSRSETHLATARQAYLEGMGAPRSQARGTTRRARSNPTLRADARALVL